MLINDIEIIEIIILDALMWTVVSLAQTKSQ